MEACLHPDGGSGTLLCEVSAERLCACLSGHPSARPRLSSPWLPGVQKQSLYCMEKQAGIVDEGHCDHLSRPRERKRKCNEEPCPAR